ncbi:hypothetical protein LINPERHAP1_LOCUS26630 [Linum perenne]
MVAIFLLTIGHNAKNRTCQLLFHRSGETIYRAIHSVLLAVLNIHTLLMAHPVAVPDNSTDHTCKHFKVSLHTQTQLPYPTPFKLSLSL